MEKAFAEFMDSLLQLAESTGSNIEPAVDAVRVVVAVAEIDGLAADEAALLASLAGLPVSPGTVQERPGSVSSLARAIASAVGETTVDRLKLVLDISRTASPELDGLVRSTLRGLIAATAAADGVRSQQETWLLRTLGLEDVSLSPAD